MMAAMTFLDVIVSNVPLTDSILFHELVHCEQYRKRLGSIDVKFHLVETKAYEIRSFAQRR